MRIKDRKNEPYLLIHFVHLASIRFKPKAEKHITVGLLGLFCALL